MVTLDQLVCNSRHNFASAAGNDTLIELEISDILKTYLLSKSSLTVAKLVQIYRDTLASEKTLRLPSDHLTEQLRQFLSRVNQIESFKTSDTVESIEDSERKE
jgi:hypothetical protein